ncbi:MAG: phosphoglycerate dehydrogenase [Gemmataceae bacterium]|nr:phosphoglycerate dehydrogenase [Gemmataceae bacterium]MDW8266587.1 phosphoglycerate dehydrogenase [Gemmataceae bacterium]
MQPVLIAPAPLAGIKASFLDVLRAGGFEPVYPAKQAQLTEAELLEALRGIPAVIAGSEPYTAAVIAAHPQLRVIARAGVGYDAVDVAAATAHGVAVTIAPGTNQDAVAEHTFALILGLAKNLPSQHNALKAGRWERRANLPVRGRTLGIVGLGRIGKAVALRAKAFAMPLLAYEPYPDHSFVAEHGIRLVSLETLLAESDFVSLHVPLTPESRYLINRRTLGLMKPTAFLVNTARGGLVNEADLLQALQAGWIAGAALDVFEEEPPPADHPLLALENVLVTPHAAGVDLQSRDEMAHSAASAIVALSRGQWPAEQIVNPEVRPHFRWSIS